MGELTPCVIHPNRTNRDGYALVSGRDGESRLAHRRAYEDAYGPIPKGLIVRHKCDVPRCVNVDHLELGTNQDNTDDMYRRGRAPVGERHGNHKLTEVDALLIRASDERGVVLADRFGVSQATISEIRRGVSWRHAGVSREVENLNPGYTVLMEKPERRPRSDKGQPRTHPVSAQPSDVKIEGNLQKIALLTSAMRVKEAEIMDLAGQRQERVRWLREQGVSYARLAAAMGVSEVACYKMIRGKDGPLKTRK